MLPNEIILVTVLKSLLEEGYRLRWETLLYCNSMCRYMYIRNNLNLNLNFKFVSNFYSTDLAALTCSMWIARSVNCIIFCVCVWIVLPMDRITKNMARSTGGTVQIHCYCCWFLKNLFNYLYILFLGLFFFISRVLYLLEKKRKETKKRKLFQNFKKTIAKSMNKNVQK